MLTSKQRSYLKSLAQPMKAIFQIGKNDISDNMLTQLSNALTARELIKVSVLETSGYTAREAAEIISAQLFADTVLVIGNKFILYRETTDAERYDNRIILPQ